ncbi:type I polyketide synthase, partial [Streptomyces racemochromogenes]
AQGHTVFVEVSAHPVLVQPINETVDGTDTEVVVAGSLRREDGGVRRLLTSMAELFAGGVAVDWAEALPATPGSARPDLPTYAFDHRHFWIQAAEPATDAASLGLAGVEHPLLGAVVQLPQSDGLLCTSRLSLRTHAWLADHAVDGVVIVPGTGLVELAVRAGDEAGCELLEELVIEAPLVVPAQGGVQVQVAVGGPGENGARTVEIYSRREDAAADGDGWTRHASGTLSAGAAVPGGLRGSGFDFAAWPPAGAEPVDISGGYEVIAGVGYGYGPAFRAVRAVWRRGEELFAEVALPEEHRAEAGRYGIHPALLDAALHSPLLNGAAQPPSAGGEGQELRLPFAWNGLALHAAGAPALRVRLSQPEPEALALEAADETGRLVVTLDSLVSRVVSAEQLETAAGTARPANPLFRVEWTELPQTQGRGAAPSWVAVATAEEVATLADDVIEGRAAAPALAVLEAVTGAAPLPEGGDPVLHLADRVLEVVQCWLAGAGLEESRLLVLTRGAVPAAGEATVTDPAASAVWGLVRAAQAENPDRIVLLDGDPAADDGAEGVLEAVLACGEPQVAVRGTALFVPRLARAAAPAAEAAAVFAPEGTVLVSGAGSLGALAARHLVARHGVRHLLLASRRGPQAEGVRELVDELGEQGATVSVVACDLSDREQAEALLASVPAEHPLTGVVHTAGVTDDGVIGMLTPERLARVFAPKVDAVRHLDELTRGLDLDAFVVYSSVSAVFMGAGSGSYAAANAFLDGLMAHRRAAGLPGLSLAWGLWEQTDGGMAAGTDDVVKARLNRRGGLMAMTPAEGMELFDAALGSGQAQLVPAKLDLRGVRGGAAASGGVPHMLRGLVKAARQQAHAGAGAEEGRGLPERLAALPAAEQRKVLLDLVRAQVAAVLGYSANYHFDADQGLFEIGFDSLTAIELRNRLRTLAERKLSPNLVFDHPTPGLLAGYLHELLCGAQAAGPLAV